VNADGSVTPLDALMVINVLNNGQSNAQIYTVIDVNADGNVTPLDALLVINYLNDENAIGEGEASEGFAAASCCPVQADVFLAFAPSLQGGPASASRVPAMSDAMTFDSAACAKGRVSVDHDTLDDVLDTIALDVTRQFEPDPMDFDVSTDHDYFRTFELIS